jgi:hypothetical protein
MSENGTHSHVLNGGQRAIGNEEEVEKTVSNDDVLSLVNDIWKRSQGAGQAHVAMRKECGVATDGIVGGRCVDCMLHIRPVEVVVWSPPETIKKSACHGLLVFARLDSRWESKLIPQEWAVVADVVKVEARIHV